MTNHKDYESPAHDSDICIIYFVFIFQCILMYYYFRFIRLLNASNCSIITISFNGFIHELFFLFKNASWYKYLARSNRAFWECYHEFIDFLFDHMLQMHFIYYLTTNNNLFLLFTAHFYDKDLGMMAFLSLHVNSINIKGSFLNKFSMKCCTCPHLCFSVDYYYSYQWYCYSFLKI